MKVKMDDLYIFSLIVQHGGISAAAKDQSLQRSTVSRRLQDLEKALGSQLLIRTTRKIELTKNGQLLFEQLNQPFNNIHQATDQFKSKHQSLTETLRIAVPVGLMSSKVMFDLIEEFIKLHPSMHLDVRQCQTSLDMKREDIDLQLLPLGSKVINEDYVQQTLLPLTHSIVTSKQYFDNNSEIKNLNCLQRHPILVGRLSKYLLSDKLDIRICSDDIQLIQHIAIGGHGVAILPSVFLKDALDSGDLIEILPRDSLAKAKLTLIHPSKEFIPDKTRSFIALLKDRFIRELQAESLF